MCDPQGSCNSLQPCISGQLFTPWPVHGLCSILASPSTCFCIAVGWLLHGTGGSKVVFMTEGILLRLMASDPLLTAYDVIIVDEVHERHLNTDFLLALLRCVPFVTASGLCKRA